MPFCFLALVRAPKASGMSPLRLGGCHSPIRPTDEGFLSLLSSTGHFRRLLRHKSHGWKQYSGGFGVILTDSRDWVLGIFSRRTEYLQRGGEITGELVAQGNHTLAYYLGTWRYPGLCDSGIDLYFPGVGTLYHPVHYLVTGAYPGPGT